MAETGSAASQVPFVGERVQFKFYEWQYLSASDAFIAEQERQALAFQGDKTVFSPKEGIVGFLAANGRAAYVFPCFDETSLPGFQFRPAAMPTEDLSPVTERSIPQTEERLIASIRQHSRVDEPLSDAFAKGMDEWRASLAETRARLVELQDNSIHWERLQAGIQAVSRQLISDAKAYVDEKKQASELARAQEITSKLEQCLTDKWITNPIRMVDALLQTKNATSSERVANAVLEDQLQADKFSLD